MRRVIFVTAFLAASLPLSASSQVKDWQSAIRALRLEKELGARCVALLKRYGDPGQIAQGSLAYEEARDRHEAAIAGLLVAMGQRASPASLPELDNDIADSNHKLEAFCVQVNQYLPSHEGKKDLIVELSKAAIEPIFAMVDGASGALWDYFVIKRRGVIDESVRRGLEDAKWPDFGSIPPEPQD